MIPMMKGETSCHSCRLFSKCSGAHENGGSLKSGSCSHKSSSQTTAALSPSIRKALNSSSSSSPAVMGYIASIALGSVDVSPGFMISNSRNTVEAFLLSALFAAGTSEYAKKAFVNGRAPFSAVDDRDSFAYRRRLVVGDVALSYIC